MRTTSGASRDASSWHEQAACQYTDPDAFFPEPADSASATVAQADPARAVCLGCPVRRECLAYALSHREAHGTWGGLSEPELRNARRRGRGRALAEIMAAADARYLRRRKRQAWEDALAEDAERRQQKVDAEVDFLLGLAA